MRQKMLTPEQVRVKGFEALVKALGVVDAIRFIQQYDLGSGDYTKEQHAILGQRTVDEIYEDIQARRRRGKRWIARNPR